MSERVAESAGAALAAQAAEDAPPLRCLAEALWAAGRMAWEWHDQVRVIRLFEVDLRLDGSPAPVRSVRNVDRDSVHTQDHGLIDEAWRNYLRGRSAAIDCTFRMRIEGVWRWVQIRGRAVEHRADGRVERIAGTLRDITEQRESEQALRLLGDAFSNAREPMVLLDRDGVLHESNQAFRDLLGLDPLETGSRLANYLHGDHTALERLLELACAGWREEFILQRADGSTLPVELALLRVLEADGERIRLVLSLSDLSLQRSVQARLRRASLQDGLTGLGNRSHFESRLKWLIARNEAQPLALLWINLDGFRAINDSLGHAAGDAFLYESAQRMLDLSGERDELARISGDEFGLLIIGEDIGSRAAGLARQVIDVIGAPMHMGERVLCVTASIGIALYPEDSREPDQLLQQAEAAMRVAKQRGRARAEFHRGELSTEAARRLELITELRRDIERDALTTVLQPKVSAGGYVVGYELLMRWNSERMGPVSPAAFIPLSEEFGLVGRLGVIAFEHAARFAKRLLRLGLHTPVAVNLSPRQVFDPETEPLLIEVCRRYRLPHDMLELELTEGALLENIEAGRGFLRRLSEQGFRLALDDFGTGFSSLAYLRRLPFNTIKIDRCFMDDIDTDSRALSLLQGMVLLCRSLDIAVVAEGVETEAQRALLVSMGVDQMQGFLFARPQRAEDVIGLATCRLPLG
jgi:diguanylate cyclase (GGDEF)-like protein/PAS domain S-box-containing protein